MRALLPVLVLHAAALELPRASKPITQDEAEKTSKQQDLDALDAAAEEVDRATSASTPRVAPSAPHVAKSRASRVHHAMVSREVVPQSVAKLSSLGAAHARDFTVSDSAEAVLARADELAHDKEARKRRAAFARVAPARVVRVNRTDENAAEAREFEGNRNLEKDVSALISQQQAVVWKARAATHEQSEEFAERAELKARQEAREAAEAKAKGPQAPAHQGTHISKLVVLSSEAQAAADAQIPGRKSLSLVRIQAHTMGGRQPVDLDPTGMNPKLEGDYEVIEKAQQQMDDERTTPEEREEKDAGSDREFVTTHHLKKTLQKMRALEKMSAEVPPQPTPAKIKPKESASDTGDLPPEKLQKLKETLVKMQGSLPSLDSRSDDEVAAVVEHKAPAVTNHTSACTQAQIAEKKFEMKMHANEKKMQTALEMHEKEVEKKMEEEKEKEAQRAEEEAQRREYIRAQQAQAKLKEQQKRQKEIWERQQRQALEEKAREAEIELKKAKGSDKDAKNNAHDAVIAYRAKQRAKKAAQAKKVAEMAAAAKMAAEQANTTKTVEALKKVEEKVKAEPVDKPVEQEAAEAVAPVEQVKAVPFEQREAAASAEANTVAFHKEEAAAPGKAGEQSNAVAAQPPQQAASSGWFSWFR